MEPVFNVAEFGSAGTNSSIHEQENIGSIDTYVFPLLSQPACRRWPILLGLFDHVASSDIHAVSMDDTQHQSLLSLVALGHVGHETLDHKLVGTFQDMEHAKTHSFASHFFF